MEFPTVNNPKISVLMSVYKEPLNWVTEAIESILNQSFSDFEFIIVNDNPESDELKSFLDDYAKKDTRINIITNPQNLGLTKSLNIGLTHCKGEYIARMDADDISIPYRFEEQVKCLDNHPEIGIVGTYAVDINEEGKILNKKNLYEKGEDLKALTLFATPFVHPSVMFRKEIIIKNPYDLNCRVGQDRELWCRLKDKTGFYNIPYTLIKYRKSSQQAFQKAGKKLTEQSLFTLDKKIIEYWGIDPKFEDIYFKLDTAKEYNEKELIEFFLYLLNKYDNPVPRYFILRRFMGCIKTKGSLKFLFNSVALKFPIDYYNTIIKSLIRLIKYH